GNLEVTLGARARGRRRLEDEPLRILVLADLSGRDAAPQAFLPRRVGFESIDDALAAAAPRVALAIDAPVAIRETLELGAIGDFHPDTLARRLGAFGTLRLLGERLSNPATRDEAFAQLAELTGGTGPADGGEPNGERPETDDDALERLLGSSARGRSASRARNEVQSFIQGVMASAPTATPPSTAESERRRIELLQQAAMRAVLLSQPLRSLERSWRSLDWLIRRLDEEIAEVHALDLSKAALAGHLREHAGALDRSALHRLLCEPAAVDQWDIIVGDYAFDLDAGDLALVATIGAIAGQAGAPFLAEAGLRLCGCATLDRIDEPADWRVDDALGRLWNEVRSHPAARWVALAAPRMLIRQPFGAATDPIDAFAFEELTPRPDHESFLWGNPAFGCAWLLAQARAGEGNATRELDEMPTVLYDDGTGQALKPPVEALLTERAINRMQASGLIAMTAHRNT
ncbi:MAG: type VI secretion system contractile sheath domain-containing protein, partial [Geminicoccales bacterium]